MCVSCLHLNMLDTKDTRGAKSPVWVILTNHPMRHLSIITTSMTCVGKHTELISWGVRGKHFPFGAEGERESTDC